MEGDDPEESREDGALHELVIDLKHKEENSRDHDRQVGHQLPLLDRGVTVSIMEELS